MKLTGILKSPNEILGVEKTVARISSFESCTAAEVSYPTKFGIYIGQRVNLKKDNDPCSNYDYAFWTDGGIIGWVKKEWLRDIREEIDWQEVPVDAKTEITVCDATFRGYFSHYDATNNEVHIFSGGATSWSNETEHWSRKSGVKTEWAYESQCRLLE